MVACSTSSVHTHSIKHSSRVTNCIRRFTEVKMLPTTFSVIALTAVLIVISFTGGQSSYLPDYSDEYPDMIPGESPIRDDVRSFITDIVPHNNWGIWSNWAYCPPGTYGIVFRLQTEVWVGDDRDDSSVNNIELACGTNHDYVFIRSGFGKEGEWSHIHGCASPQRIVGFAIYVEKFQGSCTTKGYRGCDDTATNGLRVVCGQWVNGKLKERTTSTMTGHPWGTEWQKEIECPPHSYVCGIKTQIDNDGKTQVNATLGDRDITGLNGVSMACCGWN